jgi:hypothetical protein
MTFGQVNSVHARVFPSVSPRNVLSVNSAAEAVYIASGTLTPTNPNDDTVGFGARSKNLSPILFAKMTASFGAFFSGTTSESQMQSVKNLYKQTLGLGLGLP